jgi:hypothetical protein
MKVKKLSEKDFYEINNILKNEYYYTDFIKTQPNLMYQVFDKSQSIYSGNCVVKVYNYLKGNNLIENEK